MLDEPTTGLDPQSRLFLWDTMQDLRERGTTLMLTTHDMVEADRLCDRIAIMDHGRIIALDTPRGLRGVLPAESGVELTLDADGADPAAAFPAWPSAWRPKAVGDGHWTVRLYGEGDELAGRGDQRGRAAGGRARGPAPHRGHARGRVRAPDRKGPAMSTLESPVSVAGVRRRAFLALCQRDLWVTVRHEPVGFLAQALLQPIFFLLGLRPRAARDRCGRARLRHASSCPA